MDAGWGRAAPVLGREESSEYLHGALQGKPRWGTWATVRAVLILKLGSGCGQKQSDF